MMLENNDEHIIEVIVKNVVKSSLLSDFLHSLTTHLEHRLNSKTPTIEILLDSTRFLSSYYLCICKIIFRDQYINLENISS